MSLTLTKELLHRKEDSIYKEVAIKKDATEHFFYLSLYVNQPAPPTAALPLGTDFEINVKHITDSIEFRPSKMISLSLYSSYLFTEHGVPALPVYIRFPGISPPTKYHFMVGNGVNNFNGQNTLILPCGEFPRGQVYVQVGTRIWFGTSQEEQAVMEDAGTALRFEVIELKFKINTITLD